MHSRGILDARVLDAGLHAVGIGFDSGHVSGGLGVPLGQLQDLFLKPLRQGDRFCSIYNARLAV